MDVVTSNVLADMEFFEFHDARVSSVGIIEATKAVVELAHVAVYRRETATRFGVWSYRARLEVDRLTSFAASGSPHADDIYLRDALVCDGGGAIVPTERLLTGEPMALGNIELTWLSGATFVVRGGTLTFTLLAAGERFESFEEEQA